KYLLNRTSEDGTDLGPKLIQLFEVLNTEEKLRQRNLDEELAKFPYINGNLFKDRIDVPSFDSKMRDLLIEASEFNWSKVSPAIFGSLFQSVMNEEERRSSGGHYTIEANIMK
ncbi:MAG TPA: type IIL restriction-modification enzyme MmeI, partial [Candidatus Dojkabacteria bacterium]